MSDATTTRQLVVFPLGEGDVRDALHARLVEALRPGGYLMVGATDTLPLVDASETLAGAGPGEHEYAVAVRGSDRSLALAVGDVVGRRELVTRPLPPGVGGGAPVSGGAVLSNGDIALIVDSDALAA